MKITDIKRCAVKVSDRSSPWPWLFVEVETDEGITGLGEATDTHAAPALITAFGTIKPIIGGKRVRMAVDPMLGFCFRERCPPVT